MSEKKKPTIRPTIGKKSIKRDARGRFVKGTPATNPKGRPPLSVELKRIADCQEYLQEYDGDRTKLRVIFDKLYAALGSKDMMKAIDFLLHYGCVMPTQKIEQKIDVLSIKEMAIISAEGLMKIGVSKEQVKEYVERLKGIRD